MSRAKGKKMTPRRKLNIAAQRRAEQRRAELKEDKYYTKKIFYEVREEIRQEWEACNGDCEFDKIMDLLTARGIREAVEICEQDCKCDDCLDALTAGGNEKY